MAIQDEVAATSATAAYEAKAAELEAAQHQLQSLQRRLTRDEVLEKLALEDAIPYLRTELEALQEPKDEEQVALAIIAVVQEHNRWVEPLVEAFEELISAMSAVFAAKKLVIEVHNARDESLTSMPEFGLVGETLKSAEATLAEILSDPTLTGGAQWHALLARGDMGLLVGDTRNMRAKYIAGQPIDERHLADRVARRRREVLAWKQTI